MASLKEKCKFEIGDIVRYCEGSTALMKVKNNTGYRCPTLGQRMYGIQFFGSSVGAYEEDCELVTTPELDQWQKQWKGKDV